MSFAKEDKAVWNSSEVMQELEKIAKENNMFETPSEAYEPIGEKEDEKDWEEESLSEALEEFEKSEEEMEEEMEEDSIIPEYNKAYNNALFSHLQRIASKLAENSNIKTAYRIEQTIHNLKDILEDK